MWYLRMGKDNERISSCHYPRASCNAYADLITNHPYGPSICMTLGQARKGCCPVAMMGDWNHVRRREQTQVT